MTAMRVVPTCLHSTTQYILNAFNDAIAVLNKAISTEEIISHDSKSIAHLVRTIYLFISICHTKCKKKQLETTHAFHSERHPDRTSESYQLVLFIYTDDDEMNSNLRDDRRKSV